MKTRASCTFVKADQPGESTVSCEEAVRTCLRKITLKSIGDHLVQQRHPLLQLFPLPGF